MLGAFSAHAQCMNGTMSSMGTLFKSTGNPGLDRAFNEEAQALSYALGVHPDLYGLDDRQAKNAYADCQHNRVLFGMRLLREELWSMDKGPLAIAGIMAHEFSHILQCEKDSPLERQNRELQADFLAGWYLRNIKGATGISVSGFARSLWEKGDTNFTSPLHHGTSEQRTRAMAAGFNTITSDGDEAYEASLAYFRGDSPRPSPIPSPPRMCEQRVPCQHPVLVTNVVECVHPIPCQHVFMTPMGPRTVHPADPQHPMGDPVRSMVPEHNFDTIFVPCN